MAGAESKQPETGLYGLLHVSPDANDEEVKRAYRRWAQVYHPDKYQFDRLRDMATAKFREIREAYDVLSDPVKRQVYDLYGMQGLRSGMEVGERLKSRDEIREEFEKLKARASEMKKAARINQSGSLLVNLTLADLVESRFMELHMPRIVGMAMQQSVHLPLGKKDLLVLGGNMVARGGIGGGSVMGVLKHQCSPYSSWEIMALAGMRPTLSAQFSRQLSSHASGTLAVVYSPREGTVTVNSTWTRQLSAATSGTISMGVGDMSVGWQRHSKGGTVSGDIKLSTGAFGVSAQYVRSFSANSSGRITLRFGSMGVELEVGATRKLSELSQGGFSCSIGLTGVQWKLRYTRGGQKFIVPIILTTSFDPPVAALALLTPAAAYVLLKVFVLKPRARLRAKRRKLAQRKAHADQVREARLEASRAQEMLSAVVKRKLEKQEQSEGLLITSAIYGSLTSTGRPSTTDGIANESTPTSRLDEMEEDALPPAFIDVTVPIQFLVEDNGALQLYEGVQKAGLMGFCDPCPGEEKKLAIKYTFRGQQYSVVVGDMEGLVLPQDKHLMTKQESSASSL